MSLTRSEGNWRVPRDWYHGRLKAARAARCERCGSIVYGGRTSTGTRLLVDHVGRVTCSANER